MLPSGSMVIAIRLTSIKRGATIYVLLSSIVLITQFPSLRRAEILLPAKYHLYKIYSSQKSDKAIPLKNDIITNYTNSKYAKIILNPSEVINEANNNLPENEYAVIFYEYKDDKFDSVIEKSTIAINKFEGQAIVPKFELLKAYAIGKKEGLVAFKLALDFVALNYPNTEEGKKALEVIATLKSKI